MPVYARNARAAHMDSTHDPGSGSGEREKRREQEDAVRAGWVRLRTATDACTVVTRDVVDGWLRRLERIRRAERREGARELEAFRSEIATLSADLHQVGRGLRQAADLRRASALAMPDPLTPAAAPAAGRSSGAPVNAGDPSPSPVPWSLEAILERIGGMRMLAAGHAWTAHVRQILFDEIGHHGDRAAAARPGHEQVQPAILVRSAAKADTLAVSIEAAAADLRAIARLMRDQARNQRLAWRSDSAPP